MTEPVSPSDRVKGFVQLIVVIIFIAGSFAVSGVLQSQKSSTKRSSGEDRVLFVDVQTVSPEPYRINFTTTGTVAARTNVSIVPQVSGRITNVSPEFFSGGHFESGDLLFQIDPRDYQFEIRRLRAEIASAETALELEAAESDIAIAEWALINPEQPAPPLVARVPQQAEAEAALNAARAQLSNAELNLSRTKFTLPFDGRVLSSTLEQGQYVVAGQSYGTVFDVGSLEIQAALQDTQRDWLMSTEDSAITFTVQNLGETKTYNGILKRNAAQLDTNTRFATVNFGFKGSPPEELLPGMFADIDITGPSIENVTTIPAPALQKEGNLWLLNPDDSTISAWDPDIVYADNDIIAVQGLPDNTTIITSRLSGATEGMSVNVNE